MATETYTSAVFETKYRTINPTIFSQDIMEESSTAKYDLGTMWSLSDGRCFVYSKAGGTALAAGKLNQCAAPQANHLNKSVQAAVAIGGVEIPVTIATTAVVANEYAEGYVHINDAAGEPHMYKIQSHDAAADTATCTLKIYDSVRVALTTSSEYTLTKHPMDDVIVCPTTLTSRPCGVSPIAVTASYYFWQQVSGPAAVLGNGTLVVGNPVTNSGTTAGAVDPYNEDGTANLPIVGTVLRVNASTEYSLVNLCIL